MFLVLLNGLHSELNEAVFEDTSVEALTSDNFDDFVEKSPVMVMFYATWSKQSQDFVDKYITIASDLEELITFGALDCGEYEDVCHKYEIRDFPSLVVFKNNEHALYTGARTAEAILTDVKKVTYYQDYEEYDYDHEKELSIEKITGYEGTTDRDELIQEDRQNMNNFNHTINTIDNDSKSINLTLKETPNSSDILTSNCLVLFLTMIAHIIYY